MFENAFPLDGEAKANHDLKSTITQKEKEKKEGKKGRKNEAAIQMGSPL